MESFGPRDGPRQHHENEPQNRLEARRVHGCLRRFRGQQVAPTHGRDYTNSVLQIHTTTLWEATQILQPTAFLLSYR